MIKFPLQSSPLQLEQENVKVDDKSARRLKLKKATEAFESIFISQMLKNMRSASFSSKEEDGFGKDIMLEMADEGVAKHLASTGMIGVGEVLYQNLLKRIEGEELPVSGVDSDFRLTTYLPRVIPAQADATAVDSSEANWKEKYSDIIISAAKENNLSPQLLRAVISAESNGNPSAVSRKGALGLMQLMPDTAKAIGVTDPLDPQQNISGGARYLRSMLDRFGDLRTALAAYNAGPGAVERFGGIPPYKETQSYVDRIMSQISNDN